jgi:hypothetical protein
MGRLTRGAPAQVRRSSVRTRASGVALACDITPFNHSLEWTTICAVIGIGRQKMRDAQIQHLVRSRLMINCRARSYGGRCSGEANREAPAQAELRPACAGGVP